MSKTMHEKSLSDCGHKKKYFLKQVKFSIESNVFKREKRIWGTRILMESMYSTE